MRDEPTGLNQNPAPPTLNKGMKESYSSCDDYISDYLKEKNLLSESELNVKVPPKYVPPYLADILANWDRIDISTPEKFRKEYDKHEDLNHHNVCVYLKAKQREDQKAMTAMVLIEALHDNLGFMPIELSNLRLKLAKGSY